MMKGSAARPSRYTMYVHKRAYDYREYEKRQEITIYININIYTYIYIKIDILYYKYTRETHYTIRERRENVERHSVGRRHEKIDQRETARRVRERTTAT